MTLSLIPNRPIAVGEWVRRRIPDVTAWGEASAIGIARGADLIAGVVYSNYDGRSIQMSIASESPDWCTRRILRILFDYPLVQLGCIRVTALTSARAVKTRRFLERLGFVHEGTIREGFPSGDCVVYGMLKRECRWLRSNSDFQKGRLQQLATAAA